MLEQLILTEQGFRNVTRSGAVPGFQLKIRIPYYRGVPLSQVEDVTIVVDGQAYPRERLTFSVGDRAYAFNDMKTVTDVFFVFGEYATVTVAKPGGLEPGMHTVEARILIDTGGGNTAYSIRERKERAEKVQSDPKALEEIYKYSLGMVAAGAVTKRMTLVQ